ncbi:hypothetical protein L596_025031 [Steinernema carpocapsae]|uniref:Uncharacterized protein n=1 Tax=Steinernema carpocapsae TaxID=34508 RepID=A0A4V5ZYQ3_STECR|nr:hypothetical protein L596_025031 [Steinernema carpocapsae]
MNAIFLSNPFGAAPFLEGFVVVADVHEIDGNFHLKLPIDVKENVEESVRDPCRNPSRIGVPVLVPYQRRTSPFHYLKLLKPFYGILKFSLTSGREISLRPLRVKSDLKRRFSDLLRRFAKSRYQKSREAPKPSRITVRKVVGWLEEELNMALSEEFGRGNLPSGRRTLQIREALQVSQRGIQFFFLHRRTAPGPLSRRRRSSALVTSSLLMDSSASIVSEPLEGFAASVTPHFKTKAG